MSAYLLPLSALHTAGPGVLDVVFGPDGDFNGAPRWTCSLCVADRAWKVYDNHARASACVIWTMGGQCWTPAECALDLRIPSVAARLAGLCNRAMLLGEMEIDDATADVFSRAMWGTARGWGWRDGHATFLATLTLTLAPRIAALGGSRG